MYKTIEGAKVDSIRVFNGRAMTSVPAVNSKHHNFCADVQSTVLDSCTNTPITPVGITTGVIARIPVVLAELTLQFQLSSLIRLPELALDVKNIKKRIKITQCTLLQPTNILFIKGFVRKNIDYITGNCGSIEGICGQLHHCTIDVPFECSTPLEFFTPPEELAVNSSTEFEYFKTSDLPNNYFAEKDKLLAGDLSEFNQISVENFNQLPFCELVNARMFEFDEFIGRRYPSESKLPVEEKLFQKIEEKMVVEFTVRVLQNRQVEIPAIGNVPPRPPYPCSSAID